ncbi:eukaryotic aspartyl protease [Ancylostoma ceylanicum]|uniref:Eukaryotic aspartyl protease n=1 Tax=Ancylostoma ceylanicum TaxID=53326 RepID=A0A0D6M5F0_9BILA|nr:eukaryotic aspartyl protease [Ancylostoma ceylanicum]
MCRCASRKSIADRKASKPICGHMAFKSKVIFFTTTSQLTLSILVLILVLLVLTTVVSIIYWDTESVVVLSEQHNMRGIFLLLVVFGTTLSEVHKVSLSKITSPKVQMLRAGTWTKYVEEMDRRRLQIPKMNSGGRHAQDLIDYGDIEYLGEITVGTPQQKFRVNNTEDNFCRRRRRFDSRKSSTYVKSGKKEFRIPYVNGDVDGFFGNDTVRLGAEGTDQLVIPGTEFGQGVKIDSIFGYFRFDGMLGLAFEEIAVGQVTPPFHRAVQLGLLDQPIFTVFLKQVGREENVYGGTITYGGVDVEHCEQPVIYEPLTLPLWWQFKVKGVSTGRLNVKMDWEAVSDTSTNLIVGPPGLVKVIAMENGAQVWGALPQTGQLVTQLLIHTDLNIAQKQGRTPRTIVKMMRRIFRLLALGMLS